MSKTILIFTFIIICCISIGLVSTNITYSSALDTMLKYIDKAVYVADKPLTAVLEVFGIRRANDSDFESYFYMRSDEDDSIIPIDSPYYDTLCYAVRLPKDNFIVNMFNLKMFGMSSSFTEEYRITGLTLYFDTNGKYLFSHDFQGKYSSLKDPVFEFLDLDACFGDSYLDFENITLYVKTSLNPGITYKFTSSSYEYGIWKELYN